ncbi:MAG TPA: hypothetical protein VHV55_03795 [Pirellulales bacterium]|jgi:hypothetical protein|nr:hypothetical protein [Pirellulales bacterium]
MRDVRSLAIFSQLAPTRKISTLTEAAQEVRQHIEAHTVNCCGELLLIA